MGLSLARTSGSTQGFLRIGLTVAVFRAEVEGFILLMKQWREQRVDVGAMK